MELALFQQTIPGLADKSHYDKIKIFGWWLHVHNSKPVFTGADISKCYKDLHLSAPGSFGPYISQLVHRKELLKTKNGYKLESKVREKLGTAHGTSEVAVKVTSLLVDLADQIPDMAERAYYREALICYKHGSLRGAVIMTWNVAFSHLCTYVVNKKLAEFNARWLLSMPGMHKKKVLEIKHFDDFSEELKESEVLIICRDDGILTKNMYNSMHAALGKRNAAAHPNAVVIDQLQTDATITDLIVNVIQKII